MNITLAWHITKKDLRASRDLILANVVLTIVEALFRIVWPPLTMSLDLGVTERVNMILTVTPLVGLLVFAAVVAHVVHTDPLVGADAFWLTRPISRGTLFVSKLLTLVLAVVIPAIAAQAVPMLAFGVPLLDATRLVTQFLLSFAVALMVVFTSATLTPNLRALVAWAAGLGILYACILFAAARMSLRAPVTASATELMLTFAVVGIGSSATAWHQFLTRRTRQSALFAALTVFVVTGIPFALPPPRIEAYSKRTTDEPAMPLSTGMRFQHGPDSVVMWPLGDHLGQCRVMVRVTQAPGIRPWNAPLWLSYDFVYRPTGKALSSTYFALPYRNRELSSVEVTIGPETRQRFQIQYRDATVGPVYTSDDPLTADLKSVSCRDIDVVVRH